MDRTARDARILVLLANGYTTKRIAHDLGLTEDAVNGSVRELQLRAGARNRAHLVACAFRSGSLCSTDLNDGM